MADQDRTPSADVTSYDDLSANPYVLDFFQTLRRIECENSGLPGFGRSLKSKHDPIRLGQDVSLSFAPSAIASFSRRNAHAKGRMGVWFLGLYGPNGPLPIHITEYVLQRLISHRDHTLAGFADIFHHRVLSLFYRAWANARPTVQHDSGDDRYAAQLGSLVGLGVPALTQVDAFPDHAKLHHAGWLASVSKSPEGLESMVSHYFGVEAKVYPFRGEWLEIPAAERCVVQGAGAAVRLARNSTIGETVWECQHQFRLKLGVLAYRQFVRFLPIGRSLERLAALLRNYAGDQLSWDIQLVLARDEVPGAQLGTETRLGWTSWLGMRDRQTDADDLVIGGQLARGRTPAAENETS